MKDKFARVSFKEPRGLILGIFLSIASAAICMQIMGQFGTAPNTSLIGAVLVMVVARMPIAFAQKFKNLERQNYVISIASAAGFAAANCGFVTIATMFILGRNDLIIPMAIGTLAGSMASVFILGRIFDSKIFPARAPWPVGQAVAATLQAGDEGGKKGWQLLQGLAIGAIASFFGVPAAGVGIAFIANMVSMGALAVGMILRGHSARIFGGFDIGESNIAQGVMIGAGAVALVQIFITISKDGRKASHKSRSAEYTVSDNRTRKTLLGSVALFMFGAVAIAFATGIFAEMPLSQSVLWVAFAGSASVIVMVLVGTASMFSGWAPGFAVVTLCLTIGMLIGFPPMPLAILVGYIGSVGMPLQDAGVGLKTGWLLRGQGKNAEHEKYGRRQQIIAKQIGVLVGILMAMVFGMMLVQNNIVPPMSLFYAGTVHSAAGPGLMRELVIWAIPGAILQIIFGNKSVGLMLATGLLINNPIFGISVLAAITVRLIIGTKFMTIRGPGLIAGDGLFGFGANIFKTFF